MQELRQKMTSAIRSLPVVRGIVAERRRLRNEIERLMRELSIYRTWVPPGHFYSPIPAIYEVKAKEDAIFNHSSNDIPGIDFNEVEQLKLLAQFPAYYREIPFPRQKQESGRYYFDNPNYSYSDAIIYYCMLRYTRPKQIIEIGSGYSSCVALDTNEKFFDNRIDCTFIEPYPELLQSLIKDDDRQRIRILESNLQDVDLAEFSRLTAGDILFIDSTHVSKIDSDVNYITFKILPSLNPGVLIHFHDIFFPFEYPREWIYEGRAWNEIYILRAFLQYNQRFKMMFFNTYLQSFYRDKFVRAMPLCLENPGGSLWIRKEI